MRRPHTVHDLDYEDYGPCPQCLGYVLLKDIWRHTHYRCIARDSGQAQGGSGKGELQIQSQILANNKKMSGASEELKRHVLAKMRSSNISRIAKSDGAILELGNVWLKKVGGQRKSIVSSKMLSSSRMVDELRKLCPNEGEFISDFLKPKCFDAILEAANNLGGQDITETGNSSYEKPSTVLKLGHDMKKLATIKMCRALRTGDQNLEKEAKDYLFLHEKEWGVKMSCTALTTLRERKFNRGQNLPQTSDLVKLTEHVSQQLKLAMEEIMENVSNQNYKRLQKLCLVRLLLFNKRRPGELSQLTIQAYTERPNWAEAGIQEVKDSFTSLEQKLLTAMDLVYIRGKRGTPVPVIIPEDCQQVFQQLIKLRSKVSIAHENSFLFAAMGTSQSFLRANDCLSEIVKDVDLAEPEKIKSTNMRKYLATVSQVLALKKNELDWLARHLGHDVQVHRQYYRLHESALELTKVAKLLILTEKGKVGKWTGKSLNELTLEDFPEEQLLELEDNEDEETICKGEVDEETRSKPSSSKRVADEDISASSYPCKKSKGKTSKTLWTKQENQAVWKHLGTYIRASEVPGKDACEECIRLAEGNLQNRSWRQIKFKCYNIINKVKKQTQNET